MRKILSLVLALTMLFSVAVTVSAEVSLSDYVFKGKGLDPNDDTIYTYTFGKFTGDPDEVGVKILGNKDYKLSDEALATAKANGGLFGIGLADTNNVISGSTYTVTPYAVTDGVREDGTGKEIDKNMEETVVDIELQVTDISLTNNTNTSKIYSEGGIRTDNLKYPVFDSKDGNPIPTVFGENMFDRVTKIFADKYSFYKDFPAELEGAKIFATNRGSHSGSISVNYTLKFTLNKTATLYFNTAPSCVPTGALKMDEQIIYFEGLNTQKPTTEKSFDPDSTGVSKDMWKLKCEVPNGKESETFEINLATTNYAGPILLIK